MQLNPSIIAFVASRFYGKSQKCLLHFKVIKIFSEVSLLFFYGFIFLDLSGIFFVGVWCEVGIQLSPQKVMRAFASLLSSMLWAAPGQAGCGCGMEPLQICAGLWRAQGSVPFHCCVSAVETREAMQRECQESSGKRRILTRWKRMSWGERLCGWWCKGNRKTFQIKGNSKGCFYHWEWNSFQHFVFLLRHHTMMEEVFKT